MTTYYHTALPSTVDDPVQIEAELGKLDSALFDTNADVAAQTSSVSAVSSEVITAREGKASLNTRLADDRQALNTSINNLATKEQLDHDNQSALITDGLNTQEARRNDLKTELNASIATERTERITGDNGVLSTLAATDTAIQDRIDVVNSRLNAVEVTATTSGGTAVTTLVRPAAVVPIASIGRDATTTTVSTTINNPYVDGDYLTVYDTINYNGDTPQVDALSLTQLTYVSSPLAAAATETSGYISTKRLYVANASLFPVGSSITVTNNAGKLHTTTVSARDTTANTLTMTDPFPASWAAAADWASAGNVVSLTLEEIRQARTVIKTNQSPALPAVIEWLGDGHYRLEAYGGRADGITDNTTALRDMLTAAHQSGAGGTLVLPPGTIRVNGRIDIPHDNTGTATSPSKQRPIRITGAGAFMDGRGNVVNGGSVLDLRYNGTGIAKVQARGSGLLELDHLTLTDYGTGTLPFLHTTNTVLLIHECGFVGNPSKSTTTCDQDVIILGGDTAGRVYSDADNASFQGYGTVIRDCWFNRIRRAVWYRNDPNSTVVQNLTVWAQCGSNIGAAAAAIDLDGVSAYPVIGNVVTGCLIEMVGYEVGIALRYAIATTLAYNNFYDGYPPTHPTTPGVSAADIRIYANSRNTFIITGWGNDTYPHVLNESTGDNTILHSHQGQETQFGNSVRFKSATGTFFDYRTFFTAVDNPVTVQPTAELTQDAILLRILRSAATGAADPDATIMRVTQSGEQRYGGTLAGNVTNQSQDGLTIYSTMTENGKRWNVASGSARIAAPVLQVLDETGANTRLKIGDGIDGIKAGNASDTNLYRSAANTWTTDDALIVAGTLTASGKLLANAGLVNQSGATAARPTAPSAGQQYFDTTLGKPIWYSGTAWVDATGTAA